MSEHALAVGKTFPWHELYVGNADDAKRFYADVFGWESSDMPMGEMGNYTLFNANGTSIAGCMPTAGNEQMKDVPPHWAIYIAVDDVDATVEKVTSLGGGLTVPAMDVPSVGRMALLSDPQGAHFWVYKEEARG